MSIFNREKPPNNPAPTPRPRPRERQSQDAKPRTATYIAAGSKVTGEISGSAEVLVDGVFQGRLDLDSNVVVGREGRVKGEITARAVRVEGKVAGDVRGHERVEVMASGTLEGDISASRVVIAEGAFFKGRVDMATQKSVAPAQDDARRRQQGPSHGKKKPGGPHQRSFKGQPGGSRKGGSKPAEAASSPEPSEARPS